MLSSSSSSSSSRRVLAECHQAAVTPTDLDTDEYAVFRLDDGAAAGGETEQDVDAVPGTARSFPRRRDDRAEVELVEPAMTPVAEV